MHLYKKAKGKGKQNYQVRSLSCSEKPPEECFRSGSVYLKAKMLQYLALHFQNRISCASVIRYAAELFNAWCIDFLILSLINKHTVTSFRRSAFQNTHYCLIILIRYYY